MEKLYKLSSVQWAVFEDGKVIPFVFNNDKTKIRVFGRKIDAEFSIDDMGIASYVELAYRKLEKLRRCSCSRVNDTNYIAYNKLATKIEILDIADVYGKIFKFNFDKEKNNSKDTNKLVDETSRDF